MTKAENRAAAKAYMQELEEKRSEELGRQAVKADLEAADKLRHYLIFSRQSQVCTRALIVAIDDFAELLTGDRTALHSKHMNSPPLRFDGR